MIKNPDNAPNIKKIEYNLKKISEIDSAIDEPISIVGRIVSMFPAKEFEDKNQRKRKVLNFNISDGVKQIRCVAWSPWAEVFEDQYNRGDLVQLDDVVVKEGLYDLEVYLNWSSTVIKNPELSYQIPPLKELISNEYKEEKIENLEDRNNYKIKGLIVNIIKNNLRFFKCPNCKERVYLINDEFICESCNEVVDPIVNLVANLEIDDSSGIIRTTIFNNVVEDLFKVKKEELKKDLSDEEKEELFSRIEDELIGKKVVAIGRAKINDFSSNLEFIANTIDFEDNTDSE
jgi:replication factor A1